jgi:Ras-related protein Rab-11A
MEEENLDKEQNMKIEEENIEIKRSLSESEQYDKSIKVIILGDSYVGKSSLINRLINNKFVDLSSTLSIEYHTYIVSLNDYILRMQLWDTAGQEKFNSIVSNYYKGTDVAIFLYSIDKEESFQNVEKWVKNLKQNNENSLNVLIGNKKDREKEEGGRVVTYERAEKFAEENNFFSFREITCKVGDEDEVKNISEIFDEIAKYFYDYYSHRRFASSSVDMNYVASASIIKIGENSRKKKRCCG